MDLMSEFKDYNQLIKKPINTATFLNYLLSNSNENSRYLVNLKI
jgi:hypothetical protein